LLAKDEQLENGNSQENGQTSEKLENHSENAPEEAEDNKDEAE